jgi:nickel-dependent lactate racemase
VLQGNPVAEEILQVAKLRAADFSLGLVLDQAGQLAWASAGHWLEVWQEGIATVQAWYEVEAGPFSRIVASAGGFPTDHTLIQAHKAFDAASRFVSEGGEILLVAELGGGPGSPAMEPFLDDPQPEVIATRLRQHYVQYGHTTLRIVDKTRRFKVHLVSQLDPGVARQLGFHPVPNPQEVLDRWREEAPGDTVGVMAGAAVYPRWTQGEVPCLS